MEKISGILPANARIKSVDLKNSGASRPGMPTFGRQTGTTAQSEAENRTTAQRAIEAHKDLSRIQTKEERHTAIVKRMTDGFFNKRLDPVEAGPAQGSELDLVAAEYSQPLDPSTYEIVDRSEIVAAQPAVDAEAELDMPEVGRYIDVAV